MVGALAPFIFRVLVGGGGILEAAVWGQGVEGCLKYKRVDFARVFSLTSPTNGIDKTLIHHLVPEERKGGPERQTPAGRDQSPAWIV